MFRRRKLIRIIALFFTLEMILDIALPYASFALTSGPTTPEAYTFEPVDTSNMVNLSTGDFSYTLPLIEVPGPAGGYPLSLSCHAGISPAEEASWVGLGWTLNPGSVARSVNGYPDDWKEVGTVNSQNWVGGETNYIKAGLNAPIPGFGSASNGVTYMEDTYKGSGYGHYFGVNAGTQFGESNIGFSSGLYYEANGITGPGVTLSQTLGYSKDGASVGLTRSSTFSANGRTDNFSLGANSTVSVNGYSHGSIVGASISTHQKGIATSSLGLRNSTLNKSGNVSTHTSSRLPGFVEFFFETYPFYTFRSERTRYWIEEEQRNNVFGALYNIPNTTVNSEFDTRDFDIYDIHEIEDASNPGAGITTPEFGLGNEMMLGGTVPAYDGYMVMGQGLGGSMRPYNYLNVLYRQNKKNKWDHPKTKQYLGTTLVNTTENAEFRFEHEFSNRYLYDTDDSEFFTSGTSLNPLSYAFSDTEIVSDPDNTVLKTTNELASATHVEWYSNSEIIADRSIDGLRDTRSKGFFRNSSLGDQVGAYMITNASGVTYHYTLPAYAYAEEYYTENINTEDGEFKTVINKDEKYAYTWHLTGVTGPDYVDRGGGANGTEPNGVLDEKDWGYWVSFDYGLWSDNYQWRTPETGFIEDLDGNFRDYSRGKKEIYYLNSIRTATHTALFVKDVREDGKGLSRNGRDATFNPFNCEYPTALLKLSEIILIENDDLPSLNYAQNNTFSTPSGCPSLHHGHNVLLLENIDVTTRATLDSKAIKFASFNTDYSLMPGTPNSFSNNNIYVSNPSIPVSFGGKLTLKSLQFYGKGRADLLPPLKFEYENAVEPYCRDCTDYWGSYKSDYDPMQRDINIRKMPTAGSAGKAASWSLNQITTSLGAAIKIRYSADEYRESALFNKVNLPISRLETDGSGLYKAYFDNITGQLNDYFSVGQDVNSFVVISRATKRVYQYDPFLPFGGCADVTHFRITDINDYYDQGQIQSIGSDHVTIAINTAGDEYVNYAIIDSVTIQGVPNGQNDAALCKDLQCNIDDGYETRYTNFLGGELFVDISENQYGGGLKVDEVSITDSFSNTVFVDEYDYSVPGTSESSGVTAYVPFKMNSFKIDYPDEYFDVVEGWFKGTDNNICQGNLLNLITSNLSSLFSAISPAYRLISEAFDLQSPDRQSITKILDTSLNSKEEVVRFRRSQLMSDLLAKVTEVPPPGVTYQYVTVKNKVITDGVTREAENYATHEFSVFTPDMVGIVTTNGKAKTIGPAGNTNGEDYRKLIKRGVTIEKLMAVGLNKSLTQYSRDGDILFQRINHYLHERDNATNDVRNNYLQKLGNNFNYQGAVDEVFVNGRFIPYESFNYDDNGTEKEDYLYDLVGVVTKRRQLPVVLIAEESTNYRTGVTTETYFNDFDFFTGQVTETLSKDSYSNKYLTRSTPAYRMKTSLGQTAYPGMGPKSISVSNSHMLSQTGASYSYKINTDFEPFTGVNYTRQGLLSAEVQTWSASIPNVNGDDGQDMYRKRSNYQWIGNAIDLNADGTYPMIGFDEAVLLNGIPQGTGWQRNNEIVRTDRYSHALEATDVNGNYAATKMDRQQERVYATVANASYNEFAYSGAEDAVGASGSLGGGVVHEGVLSSGPATVHTGRVALTAGQGQRAFIFNTTEAEAGRSYRVSVWSSKPSGLIRYSINGTAAQTAVLRDIKKAGDWYLLRTTIAATAPDLEVWCESAEAGTHFDDFCFHPVDATMTSYVYNEWGELEYVLDANNVYTRYEYDAMGRLVRTFRESFDHGEVKVSEHEINYARNDPRFN